MPGMHLRPGTLCPGGRLPHVLSNIAGHADLQSRAILWSPLLLGGAQPSITARWRPQHNCTLEAATHKALARAPLAAEAKRIKTEGGFAGLKVEPAGVKAEPLGAMAEPAGIKAEPAGAAAAADDELAWEDVKEDQQQQQQPQQALPGEAAAAEEQDDDEADWEDI